MQTERIQSLSCTELRNWGFKNGILDGDIKNPREEKFYARCYACVCEWV